jgi:hypothetical protein
LSAAVLPGSLWALQRRLLGAFNSRCDVHVDDPRVVIVYRGHAVDPDEGMCEDG